MGSLSRFGKRSSILALVTAAVVTLAALVSYSYQLGQSAGRAEINEKVKAKASSCHAMRNMGIGAFAMEASLRGLYFPVQKCKDFYDILGTKEPELIAQAQKLEDQSMAKVRKREAELKAQSEAGKLKW